MAALTEAVLSRVADHYGHRRQRAGTGHYYQPAVRESVRIWVI